MTKERTSGCFLQKKSCVGSGYGSSDGVMKAIQITETGGPEVLKLTDVAVPEPKENEALVQISAIGVNFIDAYNREGRYPVALPLIPGQEAAGRVMKVGAKVTEVKVDDRVAYAGVLGSY